MLKDDRPVPGFWSPDMLIDLDVMLGREHAGGPEYLVVWPSGYFPELKVGADISGELHWEPVDRNRLHNQATALLTAAQEARG
ncbi:hypothetical protein OWR29_03655 [Actinoplanes sp. Pm04-4]|uniref:Uncharacterized protein n=1 Tax=Paractinoplanes pyxinae TaxID=2997416 RepID=A0ABT4ATS4_9ACTN|nr:hypothetical protein [Actinoplanes pyxinae]MCY1137080.1 hypothetical protein [Actinoplanes pyxinae]